MEHTSQHQPVTEVDTLAKIWARDWLALIVGAAFSASCALTIGLMVFHPNAVYFFWTLVTQVVSSLALIDVGILFLYVFRKKTMSSGALCLTGLPLLVITGLGVNLAFSPI